MRGPIKAFVPLAALMLASCSAAQDTIAPDANDIALGANPSEPLLAVPLDLFPAGTVQKRESRRNTRNDRHRLAKRHYGVFECANPLNDRCKQFLSSTGTCDQNGQNCLVGCADNSAGQDTCWVGCQTGYTRTDNVNQICQATNTAVNK